MPKTAPGAERLAGGVREDPVPATAARPASRTWRWWGVGLFLLVVIVLFDAYLHLSKTYAENSDEANILLMANDMLHGNVYLSGWYMSDVPFISTELPQISLLVWMFGLHLNTAHIAAAVTYTLVVGIGMLLAKGSAQGWAAVARMAIALGIMLAPQPGVGIFVVIFSVGHIGTALPVLLTWLVLDRLGRRWYVPVIVAVMLAWALMADPLVLVVAIYPMLAVCLARVTTGVFTGALRGGGLRGMWRGLLDRWLELSLAAAAGASYLIITWARVLLNNAGGYVQNPVPYALDATRTWFWHAQVVVHGLLEMFGAYFVTGNDPKNFILPMGGLDQAIALTHLVGVVLAVWGACAIARRFFFRDADFVSQLLLAGIVANIFAYIPSTLAHATALNAREIAPVLPFAAVLAGRMLGDRVLTGPLATIRLPRSWGAGPAAASTSQAAASPAPVTDSPSLAGASPDLAVAASSSDVPPPHGGHRAAGSRRSLGVRLIAIPLVLLFGWYSFGLFRQADTPAAPEPLTQVASFLEAHHLKYGVGGYWDASVLTVETGGKVTIRAVTPGCLQPYLWESKLAWYDPAQHSANFILLSQVTGYFSKFAVSRAALLSLNQWYGTPAGLPRIPQWHFGGGGQQNSYYSARVYPANLLAQMPRVKEAVTNPPPWLVKQLNGRPPASC